MTKNSVDLSQYEADPRVIEWLGANGLEANLIPVMQVATIEQDTLTIQEHVLFTEAGLPPYKKLNAEGTGYERVTRTVPLLSAPENHGL